MLNESESDIMYEFDLSHRIRFGHVHGSDLSGHYDRPNPSLSHQTQKQDVLRLSNAVQKCKKLDISMLSGPGWEKRGQK